MFFPAFHGVEVCERDDVHCGVVRRKVRLPCHDVAGADEVTLVHDKDQRQLQHACMVTKGTVTKGGEYAAKPCMVLGNSSAPVPRCCKQTC